MALEQAIIQLDQLGLTDVLLPFALIFTVIYAVSAQVPLLSGSNNKIRTIISLVISLLVVIPHVTNSYPSGFDVITIINNSIPQVALLIVAVVLVLMLIGATGFQGERVGSLKWVRWGALIIVGLIFLDNINNSVGRYGFLSWFSDPDLQALLLVILVFALVVGWVTGGFGGGGKSRCKCGNDFDTEQDLDTHIQAELKAGESSKNHGRA